MYVAGWDCTFRKWGDSIEHTHSRLGLLLGFFQFYDKKKQFEENVLCILTGKLMDKKTFFTNFKKLTEISEIQRTKFITFESKIVSSFEKYSGLALQDPFELSFNITKKINRDNLTTFCKLCSQSAKLLRN